MKKVKLTYKDNKFVIIDLETNKEITNITNIGFKHVPGQKPVCVIETQVEIQDYSMEINLDENTKQHDGSGSAAYRR